MTELPDLSLIPVEQKDELMRFLFTEVTQLSAQGKPPAQPPQLQGGWAGIAPGWISLSLQQSDMFFLISFVLFVLGEHVLRMASLSNEGPLYHVGQEFIGVRMTRRE